MARCRTCGDKIDGEDFFCLYDRCRNDRDAAEWESEAAMEEAEQFASADGDTYQD